MAFIPLNPVAGTGFEESRQLVIYSSSGPSSSSNGTYNNQYFENEDDEERVEYPGSSELPAASVIGMAQSVGVTLSEDVAAALGDLAMKKLRTATLLAVGFADHENSCGLRTVDFSKAEHALNLPSYGHLSCLPNPRIRPIVPGNFSVLEEGPEIDLMTTISGPQISEFHIRNLDPEFHVHQTVINSRYDAMNFLEEDNEEEEEESTIIESDTLNNHNELSNHVNDPETGALNHNDIIQNGPTLNTLSVTDEFEEEQSTVDEASSSHNQYLKLDQEWLEYMKVFVNCFLDGGQSKVSDGSMEDGVNENQLVDNEKEFQCIVEDLVNNSAFPIADVICDFFCDYLNGPFTLQVSSTALHRIVSVVNAFLCGSSTPSLILMRKMSSVLIEILVRPPGCEVQPTLVLVFMKILKSYDELLTWACSYITEVLKRTSEMAAEDISDEYKCLLHGALLLANGLELLDIKVAHEFGWDSSIAGIKRTHYEVKEGSVKENIDVFLEEEFTKFDKSNSNGS